MRWILAHWCLCQSCIPHTGEFRSSAAILTAGASCSSFTSGSSKIERRVCLQEYKGIDVQRLEQMEARLKADVLREAAEQGGKLLVAREVMGSSEEAGATIVDAFVDVAGDL